MGFGHTIIDFCAHIFFVLFFNLGVVFCLLLIDCFAPSTQKCSCINVISACGIYFESIRALSSNRLRENCYLFCMHRIFVKKCVKSVTVACGVFHRSANLVSNLFLLFEIQLFTTTKAYLFLHNSGYYSVFVKRNLY